MKHNFQRFPNTTFLFKQTHLVLAFKGLNLKFKMSLIQEFDICNILPAGFSPHLRVNGAIFKPHDHYTVSQKKKSLQLSNTKYLISQTCLCTVTWAVTAVHFDLNHVLLQFFYWIFFWFIGFLIIFKTQLCEILFINSSFHTGFVDQEILEDLEKNKQTNPKEKRRSNFPSCCPVPVCSQITQSPSEKYSSTTVDWEVCGAAGTEQQGSSNKSLVRGR